jgi:ferric-dicitrate binding protein FerR (iron transport regulator)
VGAAAVLGLAAVAQASAEPLFVEGCDTSAEIVTACTSIRWDRGFLRVACARLADVIAEYNRHAAVKLAVSDAELADALVGGAFRTEDPEAFAGALRQIMPVRAERRGDTMWLMPSAQ